MNRIINELACKALDIVVSETWTMMSYEQLEKFQQEFAKLLIKECANYIVDVHDDYFVSEQLIDHFGV